MTEKIMYKIRHKVTGLYSRGSSYADASGLNSLGWNKSGKTWDTLGKLRAHITMHLRDVNGSGYVRRQGTDMSDWQVVEYKVIESEIKRVDEIIDPKKLIKMLSQ